MTESTPSTEMAIAEPEKREDTMEAPKPEPSSPADATQLDVPDDVDLGLFKNPPVHCPIADLHPHAMSAKFPMGAADWPPFLQDVLTLGVKVPVVVAGGNVVVDGAHRLRAATERGDTHILAFSVDLDESQQEEFVLRAGLRRNLTEDQRAYHAAQWRKMQSARLRQERAAKGGSAGGRGRAKSSDSLASKSTPKQSSLAEAAHKWGVPECKVKAAVELVNQDPQLAEQVQRGELTLKQAKRQLPAKKNISQNKPRAKKPAGDNEGESTSVANSDPLQATPADAPAAEEVLPLDGTANTNSKAPKGSQNYHALKAIIQTMDQAASDFVGKCRLRPGSLAHTVSGPGRENDIAIKLSDDQRANLHEQAGILLTKVQLMQARVKPKNLEKRGAVDDDTRSLGQPTRPPHDGATVPAAPGSTAAARERIEPVIDEAPKPAKVVDQFNADLRAIAARASGGCPPPH